MSAINRLDSPQTLDEVLLGCKRAAEDQEHDLFRKRLCTGDGQVGCNNQKSNIDETSEFEIVNNGYSRYRYPSFVVYARLRKCDQRIIGREIQRLEQYLQSPLKLVRHIWNTTNVWMSLEDLADIRTEHQKMFFTELVTDSNF